MAVTLNALTTGVGGLQTTGDTSGNISLQSNGTNVLNTTSTGVTVPGTLGVTGAMTASGGLAVTGTLTVNGVAPGRSGASYITLNSGTTNVTLTSSSNQLQVVSATGDGQSITLPNMTTLTKGSGYFVFYNTSAYAIAIKDTGGTVREYLYPSTTFTGGTGGVIGSPISAIPLNIEDTSSANGVWHLQNPVSAGSFAVTSMTSTSASMTALTYYAIFYISPTQYLLFGSGLGGAVSSYIKLATLDTSTKTFSFGSEITLNAGATNNNINGVWVDTNGVDKALLMINYGTGTSSTAMYANIFGLAIVAGTLYASARTQVSTQSSSVSAGGDATSGQVWYSGSSDCFLAMPQNYVSGSTNLLRILAYKVTVSGTTVSLTAATGNNISYSLSSTVSIYMSPTSKTTFVVDTSNNATRTYINYDPTTNTLTSGNRTAQTTIIANALLPNMLYSSYYSGFVMAYNSSYFVEASNSKIIYANYVAATTNVGTANVTVSNPTYSIKSFPSNQYGTESTGAGVTNYYASSGTSYYSIYGGYFYNFDPTNTNFNFNKALITLPGTQNYFTSASQLVSLTLTSTSSTAATITCSVVSPATPFVS